MNYESMWSRRLGADKRAAVGGIPRPPRRVLPLSVFPQAGPRVLFKLRYSSSASYSAVLPNDLILFAHFSLLSPMKFMTERLSSISRIRTDQVTCNVFASLTYESLSCPVLSPFPETFPPQQTLCPRHLPRPHPPPIINPSSTMRWRLTRRRQRKISSPTHYSPDSKHAIPLMQSLQFCESKSLHSTNLILVVMPMTNSPTG